jgi:hypothetical protein
MVYFNCREMAGHVPVTDETRSASVTKQDISCVAWNELNEVHHVEWEGQHAVSTRTQKRWTLLDLDAIS